MYVCDTHVIIFVLLFVNCAYTIALFKYYCICLMRKKKCFYQKSILSKHFVKTQHKIYLVKTPPAKTFFQTFFLPPPPTLT